MTLQVIGAGLGRTGTMSLKVALEALGIGRCYHMIEIFGNPGFAGYWERIGRGEAVDWDEVFKGYGATVDWPSCNYYRQLADYYPQAKVILTVRDPDQWFESTQNTIFKDLETIAADPNNSWSRMVSRIIVAMFGGRIHDRAHAIAVYKQHNETVQRTIPKERLLVYEAGQGWEPLCRFLGVPVPQMPYPKTNTTDEFMTRQEEIAGARAMQDNS